MKYKALMSRGLLLVLMLGLSVSASANLITNGGFEDTVVNNGNGGWQWYNSSNVAGWQGSNIEIWDNFGAIGAYEGSQHAELNAHRGNGSAFSIFQTFSTAVGESYDLSFAYGARRHSREAFLVEVADLDFLMDDHVKNRWSLFSNTFVAQDEWTTLSFTSVIPERGTLGNFIDDIRVRKSSIPEPSSIVLMGLGMFSLIIVRKKTG